MKVNSDVVPSIKLFADNEQQEAAIESALTKILSKPTGNGLLRAIQSSSTNEKNITIVAYEKRGSSSAAILTQSQITKLGGGPKEGFNKWSNQQAAELSTHRLLGGKGEGVSAYVYWNQNESIKINDKKETYRSHDPEDAFLTLGHELIHAFYILNGQRLSKPLDPEGTRIHEEERAMGVGQFSNAKYSENALRKEHGRPLRKEYYSIN